MNRILNKLSIMGLFIIFTSFLFAGCESSGGSENPTLPPATISTSDASALTDAITISGSSKITGTLPGSTVTTGTPVILKVAEIVVPAGKEVEIPVFLGDPVISKSSYSKAAPDISCIYVQIEGSSTYWKITQFSYASGVVYFRFTMPAEIEAGQFKLIIRIENSSSQVSASAETIVTVTDTSGSEIALPVGSWAFDNYELYATGDDGMYTTSDDLLFGESYDFKEGNRCIIYKTISRGVYSGVILASFTYNCTYVVGDLAVEPEGARKIDITQTSVTVTLFDTNFVASANAGNYCGYNDWVIGKAKDVAGKELLGETPSLNGIVRYTVYKIDGGKFYIGDEAADPLYDGSSDGNRPRVLYDITDPYAGVIPTLDGTWGKTYYEWYDFGPDDEDETADDEWRKTTVEINGNSMTLTYDFAYGKNTSSLTPFARYQRSHTFVTGDAVTIPSGASKIDFTQTSVSYTLYTVIGVSNANAMKLYDYNDWVLNTPKDIAGKTNSKTTDTEAVNGTVLYSVYQLELRRLRLGEYNYDLYSDYDGSTDALRYRRFMLLALDRLKD